MAGSQSFWEEGLLVTSSSLTSGWRRIENRGQNPQDAVNAGAGPQGHSLPPWPAAQHRPWTPLPSVAVSANGQSQSSNQVRFPNPPSESFGSTVRSNCKNCLLYGPEMTNIDILYDSD